MTPPRTACLVCGLALALLLPGWPGLDPGLCAQQPHWLGFRGDLGAEVPLWDAGKVFQGNIRGEFSLLFQPSFMQPFYFGAGLGWVTYHLEEPYVRPCDPRSEVPTLVLLSASDSLSCESWNSVGVHLLVGIYLDQWVNAPVYAELRGIERRLRPMDTAYWDINSDDYIKQTPYLEYSGFGLEGVVGVRKSFNEPENKTLLDVALRFGQFKPDGVQFTGEFEHLPDVGRGWVMGLQLGVVWFP
jgi:hypothetical protein